MAELPGEVTGGMWRIGRAFGRHRGAGRRSILAGPAHAGCGGDYGATIFTGRAAILEVVAAWTEMSR